MKILRVMTKIAIIDYQAGNIRSVQKALENFDCTAVISSDPEVIFNCDGVILPGQGACDSSIRKLRELKLVTPLKDYIREGLNPYLGICLGLQLLFQSSEEGNEACLGIFDGVVRRLPGGQKLPHIGWNDVEFSRKSEIWNGVKDRSYFYFVHSYFADPVDETIITGETTYGDKFTSAVSWGNANAVQFHPEKSGNGGLRIYKNFIDLTKALRR